MDNLKKLFGIISEDATRVASSLNFSAIEGKTVLVTGANGLIGLNFIFSLVEISKNIPGIKIFAVIKSRPSQLLASLEQTENFIIFRGDLTDHNFIDSLPESDIIIHAAGSGVPTEFLKNKLSSIRINTSTTFNLFDKLKKNGRFLFISSSDVYNGLDSKTYTEEQIGTTNTNHPRACYIEGKRIGETFCNILHEQGENAVAVRLSLTYGPGVSLYDSRVLPTFIRKALDGNVKLLDSGEASRTFLYISDAVEMMWFSLLFGKKSLYNIGGNDTISIRDLARLIGRLLEVPVDIPSVDLGILGAPKNVRLNTERYYSEGNKAAFISLETGIKNTIEWLRLSKFEYEKGI
jgi:UDP-glucuronate decarboxylase